MRRIVIATRESALAMWQARHIESLLLAQYPDVSVEILGLTTEGDRRLGVSLARIGGKGLFVKELEEAIARGDADIAVHSMKDVPMDLHEGHIIAAVPERADPRDAFVSKAYANVEALPAGARVGTSSLRRESQLRARRPDLTLQALRGNVTTRLRKLDDGAYDAILLAAAGLKRLGLDARITALMSTEESLPAAGQGALAVECRAERSDLVAMLKALDHAPTALCVRAERAVARALAGSCNVPLAALGVVSGSRMRLRGYVGAPDGSRLARAEIEGEPRDGDEADALGVALAQRLRECGAESILSALEPLGARMNDRGSGRLP